MNTKTIAGTSLFCALACVLTIASNYIIIGGVNINLSIAAVAVAGILFGPVSGGLVGLINGIITLFAPTTIGLFFPASIVGTLLICLTKGTIAGILAGIIHNLFRIKHPKLSIVLGLLIVPIINTGLFVLLSLLFYGEILAIIFTVLLLVNFGIEFVVCASLSPVLFKARKFFNL